MADIFQEDRNAFHDFQEVKETKTSSNDGAVLNIAKVFLYVFIGLLITTAVAFGLGAILTNVFAGHSSDPEFAKSYAFITFGAAIALIIDVIVIQFVILRGRHSILVPAIIYSVLVGVMISSLTVFIDFKLIALAFGATCAMFLIMSLIAFLSKGSLAPLLVLSIGLLMGIGLVSLFGWLFMLFNPSMAGPLYWIIIFGIFAVMIFVTIFDLWNIKKIAERGALNGNVSLYCAFNIYVDFINIFLRVLYFIILINGKRK